MRILVLGAGYAGLTLARKLERTIPDDVDLLVVERTGTHLVQHELHRVIRRPSLAEDIVVPLDEVLDRAEIRRAEVTDVDPEANVVTLDSGETLDYDYAAVCLGAETAFYGLPGVEAHATPLKSLEDAERIRAEFLDALDADGRIVVGGAGLSGVQVAGELAAFASEERESRRESERTSSAERGSADGRDTSDDVPRSAQAGSETEDPPRTGQARSRSPVRERTGNPHDDGDKPRATDDDAVTITLLEQFDSVAPSFPENFQQAVRDELEARDVDVRTNTTVIEATGDAVRLESGAELAYDQFVWTGGIRGPSALDGERPKVRNTLQLDRDTFVVGDAARVVDADGEPVPASAQSAVREARAVAENIARLVEHDLEGEGVFEPRLEPFAFDSPGWLVSVGDGAVAQVGPTVLTGRPARALKTTVGAGYLSSVGAIRNAADLVGEELGYER